MAVAVKSVFFTLKFIFIRLFIHSYLLCFCGPTHFIVSIDWKLLDLADAIGTYEWSE